MKTWRKGLWKLTGRGGGRLGTAGGLPQSLKLTSRENLKELPPPPSPALDPGFMQVLILGPCHPREAG